MSNTVTMDDIAAHAGVSRGAVSLAMRGSPKISGETTAHILAIAKSLGYRPNINASRLARANASTVGVLVSDLHNPIMADVFDGFSLGASAWDSDVYLASGFNDRNREKSAIESFLAHRLKAVVLIGSLLKDADIRDLGAHVPTVIVGRDIRGLDCVLVDSKAGGRLAAEHLIGLGHRRFAHIDGGQGAGAAERRSAFVETIEAQGHGSVELVAGDYTQEGGYEGAMRLFRAKKAPAAIFAANDLMALGVLGAAQRCGRVAGVDFSLVGFDDIALSAYDYVSLTTISYARADMGAISRSLLERRCAEPDRPRELVTLAPTLVVRKSSAKAQSA